MTSRDPDLRQPWPWPTLDVLLLRQVADDLELVAEHGRRDDVVAIARDARRACDDGRLADEQAAYWDRLGTPADALAIDVCGGLIDAATVRGVLAWHRHRRRLRAALAVVRDEAARLRAERKGARR